MWETIRPSCLKQKTELSKDEFAKLLRNGSTEQKTLVPKILEIESSGGEAQQDGVDQKKGNVTQVSSSGDSSKQKATIKKIGNLTNSIHATFGPYYIKNVEMSTTKEAKKTALEKALGITDRDLGDDQSREMKNSYEDAVSEIQIEAIEQYVADDLDEVIKHNRPFKDMMMMDGCFFLQLALLLLGHEESLKALKYLTGDAIFGGKVEDNDFKVWIESMFFVGNQIPFIVLHALMATPAPFCNVLQLVRRSPPPTSGFCKKVFYKLLTDRYKPADGRKEGDLPSDCIHALHKMFLGPGHANTKISSIYQKEGKDLEANNVLLDKKNMDRYGLEQEGQSTPAIKGEKKKLFPTATELHRSSIFIRKLKNEDGIRSIRFRSYYVFAFLDLPEFPYSNEASTVLRSLKDYEASQKTAGNGGEVASYIRMMSDIIQTPKDVKYLGKRKIVQYDYLLYEDELPEMLEKMSNQEATLTNDFRILKHKILDYSGPPWTRIKSILNLVALLTVLQTVFTVLGYFRPPP